MGDVGRRGEERGRGSLAPAKARSLSPLATTRLSCILSPFMTRHYNADSTGEPMVYVVWPAGRDRGREKERGREGWGGVFLVVKKSVARFFFTYTRAHLARAYSKPLTTPKQNRAGGAGGGRIRGRAPGKTKKEKATHKSGGEGRALSGSAKPAHHASWNKGGFRACRACAGRAKERRVEVGRGGRVSALGTKSLPPHMLMLALSCA